MDVEGADHAAVAVHHQQCVDLVRLHQLRGFHRQRVVYNMKTNQVESGGTGNGRVKMRILPKSAQAQPAKAAAAPVVPAPPAGKR